MRLNELRLIARDRGIETRNRKKEELIRAILEGERHCDCAGEYTSRPEREQVFSVAEPFVEESRGGLLCPSHRSEN